MTKMFNKINSKRPDTFEIPYFISFFSTVLALGMYAYIGWFNRLLGDSLCSYYYAERLGLLRSIWYWRITWSGRYSAYGFDWLTAQLFPAQNIPFFIPVVILIWMGLNILAVFLALRETFGVETTLSVSAILGVVSVFLTLVISPYVEQSFFWIDGFRAYTLPVILLALYATVYFFLIDRINSKVKIGFASLLSFSMFFVSGGLSETFAAVQFSLLIFVIFYYWLTEKPSKFDRTLIILISGWIGSIIAIVVIFTAPGNEVRQGFFPQPPDLLTLIFISLNAYADFFITIFSTPQKGLALLGGLMISVWVGTLTQRNHSLPTRRIILLLIGAILLPFTSFPPGVYGYSEPPPARVLIIAVFILVSLLMLAGVKIGNALGQQAQNVKVLRVFFSVTAAAFLFCAAAINSKILFDGRNEYITYAQEWDRTDAIIKTAKKEGKDVITVNAIPNWAGMDLLSNDNRNHWVNECYSFYYGIQVFGIRP